MNLAPSIGIVPPQHTLAHLPQLPGTFSKKADLRVALLLCNESS